MSFELDNSMISGIDEIDEQHKHMYKTLQHLKDGATGKEAVLAVLISLNSYGDIHFRTEENYMQEYDYPHFERHKKEHRSYFEKFQNLMLKIATSQNLVNAKLEIFNLMSEGIDEHFKKEDKEFIEFLKTKNK